MLVKEKLGNISTSPVNNKSIDYVWLDWYETNASKYPHRLFDYHQQLLREGMFDAYNQWLFGTVENLTAYDSWTRSHADEYKGFVAFQKTRVFRVPPGQYYQAKN